MRRRFAIGDLHGGYKGLVQCLERCNFDFENDELIVLGDICDGWSEFLECIDLLSKVKNIVKIIGNHDEWAIKYAKGLLTDHHTTYDDYVIWQRHGGAITCKRLDEVEGAKEKLIKFFEDAKYYHVVDDMCFVHAGLSLVTPIEKLPDYFYTFDRTFFEIMYDRYALIDDHRDVPFTSIYKKVFVGHTPTFRYEGLRYNPFVYRFMRGLDTGAAFSGPVTIMNVDTDQYYQSDLVYTLYPNEKGRNKTSLNG